MLPVGGGFLGDGEMLGVAIDGGRRREEDVGTFEFLHQLKDVHIRYQIVLIVLEGFAHRFAYGLVCGKMDDGAKLVTLEYASQGIDVACVALLEGDFATEDFLYALDSRRLRV